MSRRKVRKVRAAQSTTTVNGRQAAMFGHRYRDESQSDSLYREELKRGETSTLWAAIPSKPTFERCSRKLEGRKREKHVVTRDSRLMIDAKRCTKGRCTMYNGTEYSIGTEPGL